MVAKTIMIQGTGSNVGKSIIVTALCRIFSQDGYKVAPFKSQNMSLNSFSTIDGSEIGMAQAVQAEAAGIVPSIEMNPILLKPTSNMGSQVIIKGKPIGHMSAKEYMNNKTGFLSVIKECLTKLTNKYEILVIEGAGSPAEINLSEHDIVNMKIAELADSPVILVGDIDKGGVFASIVGTLELLEKKDRERIVGVIINKFRGDIKILEKGLDMLEERTGVKVLGVLPYFNNISIYPEDSMSLDMNRCSKEKNIKISVIKLPMISNFTDFEPFKQEGDVTLQYVVRKEDLIDSDIIIIPGTKNTISDLIYLKSNGFFEVLDECRKLNKIIIGICGGFQMLGRVVIDDLEAESTIKEAEGLGYFNMGTYYRPTKITEQVEAVTNSFCDGSVKIKGYEIHMGRAEFYDSLHNPLFKIISKGGKAVEGENFDGVINKEKNIWGTYIHGLFENNLFRKNFLNTIRKKKGFEEGTEVKFNKDVEYDKLAAIVREHINIIKIFSKKN